ncbi:MAG: hypothetical protein K2L86_01450 [Lachnospiraceae bacterium]|nr:hypothetical protein [Lachnospiraceae bacterium]
MSNMEYVISLTGKDSHKVVIPAGQGTFSIGTKGISEGEYDVWVEQDSRINWDAFNEFYTGYGREHKEKYPYGNWPRWFYYSGNDTGFIEWSAKRRIEEFHWAIHTDLTADFADAEIGRLGLHTEENTVQIVNCEKIVHLTLSGRLENFDLKPCEKLPYMVFCPESSQLPVFPALVQITALDIYNTPAKAAFDCESLLQFKDLKAISLHGNLTNLSALAQLRHLESIALRYVPDLEGMPQLHSWDGLTYFIGYNIEETAGKTLRTEVRQLKKEKSMEHASVSKLRKRVWFVTEYGMPFSEWEEKTAKKAARAYKSCFNQIKKSQTEEEVHKAVIEFIGRINRLDGIETTEREDVYTAIMQLKEGAIADIPPEKWEQWFDEVREF